jgi:hypothetical protein
MEFKLEIKQKVSRITPFDGMLIVRKRFGSWIWPLQRNFTDFEMEKSNRLIYKSDKKDFSSESRKTNKE